MSRPDAQVTKFPSSSGRAPVEIISDHSPVPPASVRLPVRQRRGTGYARYRYLIGGSVSVISEVRLPELEYFRVPKVEGRPDIEIRRGHVGPAAPRRRAHMIHFSQPAAVRYQEHLGAISANFAIDLGETIRITVSPLLAMSPHVLYTNVVEALLRFTFVARGQILLHSACLDFDGVGLMLSAKTDTGKTGTVLRLLREKGGKFLSDDMTIVDEQGLARAYPKPLTISAHTLRAVDPGDVSRTRWGVLNVQGRIHSKGGRAIGMGMGEMNLPIMTANSLVQMVVPPPKYPVDRLVACELTDQTQVRELFIIERGAPALSEVSGEQALAELLENTDDAYGFPPFRYFAQSLVIGGENYAELRRREAAILRRALQHVRVRRLASNSFSWADEIPELIGHQPEAAHYEQLAS